METELIQLINKEVETDFPEITSVDDLQEKLCVFINDLIEIDFQRLVTILYKVDVDENKLKTRLKKNEGEDTAAIIADMIIERGKQKVRSRKEFKEKNSGIKLYKSCAVLPGRNY